MHKVINRGFTLIELLVVIAIIGILAGIVLASLGTARNKGKDASIQAQLANMRNAAEIYYGTNGKYNTTGAAIATCTPSMFADTTSNFKALMDAVATASNGSVVYTNMTCGITAAGDAYAVSAKLPGVLTFWCVDSNGASKSEASAPAAGATVCP